MTNYASLPGDVWCERFVRHVRWLGMKQDRDDQQAWAMAVWLETPFISPEDAASAEVELSFPGHGRMSDRPWNSPSPGQEPF